MANHGSTIGGAAADDLKNRPPPRPKPPADRRPKAHYLQDEIQFRHTVTPPPATSASKIRDPRHPKSVTHHPKETRHVWRVKGHCELAGCILFDEPSLEDRKRKQRRLPRPSEPHPDRDHPLQERFTFRRSRSCPYAAGYRLGRHCCAVVAIAHDVM